MRPTRFATNTSADGISFQCSAAALLILWVTTFFMPMGCGRAQPEGTTDTETVGEDSETDEPKTEGVTVQWYMRSASDEKGDWQAIAEQPTMDSLPSDCVLKVQFCLGADEDLKKLQDFRNIDSLQYLDLEESDVTDAGLAYLKAFHNLRSLNLFSCHRVTDAGIEHLKTLTNLEHLDLSGGYCC